MTTERFPWPKNLTVRLRTTGKREIAMYNAALGVNIRNLEKFQCEVSPLLRSAFESGSREPAGNIFQRGDGVLTKIGIKIWMTTFWIGQWD
jgi:hypothetical protein